MSELLGLGREPRPVAWNPLPVPPRGFAERFRLDYEAERATGLSTSRERNYALAFEQALEDLGEPAAAAGLRNPYADFAGGFGAQLRGLLNLSPAERDRQAERERQWDETVARLRIERPELTEKLRDAAAVRAEADRRARELAEEAERAVGLGGGLGGFLGTAAAIFTDPLQVLALPLGAGRLAGSVLSRIGKAALIEGGVAAGVQAGVELGAGAYRAEIGAPGDSAERIAAAAAGGAVIGGGLRALLIGLERAAARAVDQPAGVVAQDAAALARTEALAAASRPGPPDLAAAHDEALADTLRRHLVGEPPRAELPPPTAPVAEAQRLAGLPPVELRRHVQAAVDDALAARGVRDDVAWRADLGAIGVRWGAETEGLAAIIARRRAEGLDGEAFVRERLPGLLLDGRLVEVQDVGGPRAVLELGDTRAELRLQRTDGGEIWSVTDLRVRGADAAGAAVAAEAPAPLVRAGTSGDLAAEVRRLTVYTPTGRAVLVEPRIVSLRDLVVSHGPDGTPNPAYPHAEGLQPRDRSAAPSRDQVRAIAARLQPERLMPNSEAGAGAPIVGPDLVVESGNARVAALTLMHRSPDLAERRAAYLDALRRAGFAVDGIDEPVLVSARVTPLNTAERAAFVREANLRATAADTLAEMATRDAEAVTALFPWWRGGTVDQAANREFVRRFLDTLTAEERVGLLDRDGAPTVQLMQRLDRALLQAAYGDALGPVVARLIAGETEGIRGLAAALRTVAGDWAALRADIAAGRVPVEYDATPALAEAVGALAEAQQRRLRVHDLVRQVDLAREPMTPAGEAMLRAFHPDGDLTKRIKGEARLVELLRGYVDRARQAQAGPALFELPPVRPEDAIAAAARAEDGPPVRAGDPQAARLEEAAVTARRLAQTEQAEDAALLEARRIAAEADIAVPDETGTVPARALLDAAEQTEAEAAAAVACLVGAGAA